MSRCATSPVLDGTRNLPDYSWLYPDCGIHDACLRQPAWRARQMASLQRRQAIRAPTLQLRTNHSLLNPIAAELPIGSFDCRPSNAKRQCLAFFESFTVGVPGRVECFTKNVLSMLRQMLAHGWWKIEIRPVWHLGPHIVTVHLAPRRARLCGISHGLG